MIDSKKIENYCNNFYGYGNWESPIWFVGIEENGGYSKEEVQKRIDSWLRFKSPLIDNKEHHLNLNDEGITKLFTEGKRQPTWWKLIRLKLNYDDIKVSNEKIQEIQKHEWGQLNSKSLIIEMFPLPSPSIKHWKYNNPEWSNLESLESREKYFNTFAEKRVDFIKNQIKKHKPKAVIFYANKLIKYWDLIIEDDFNKKSKKRKINKNYFRFIKKESTCYFQTPQPAGVWENDFWDKLGKEIKKIYP